MSPRVIVVMPVFNGQEFLCPAIDSLLGQTFKDFLVFIVNDGSTDCTSAIIAKYEKKDGARVFGFNMPEHVGLSRALNIGVDSSRLWEKIPEFIARMDADDVCRPERLALEVEFLEANPSVAMVGTQFLSMTSDLSKTLDVSKFPVSPEEIRTALPNDCCFCHPSIMIRTSVMLAANGYSEKPEHEAIEDYELWLRLSKTNDLANLPYHLLIRRSHPGQVSRRLSPLQFANLLRLRKTATEERTCTTKTWSAFSTGCTTTKPRGSPSFRA